MAPTARRSPNNDAKPVAKPWHTVTVDQLISDAEWRRSAFYLLYCEPYDCFHMLGADIRMPDGGTVRFRINRPEHHPRFGDTERAMCAMLLPHLRRALHMHAMLDRSESLGSLY